ncbi:hypothetical protein ACJZ2D_003708 [Fusarium nematophilum]
MFTRFPWKIVQEMGEKDKELERVKSRKEEDMRRVSNEAASFARNVQVLQVDGTGTVLKRIRNQICDAGEEAEEQMKNPRLMHEIDEILEDIEEKVDEQREPPELVTQLEKLLRAAMKNLLMFVGSKDA